MATLSQTTDDLGKVDDLIQTMVGSLSPIPTHLRNYQAGIRDQSKNIKWIYLKWKASEQCFVPVNHPTDVSIQLFDCFDGKPAPEQTVKLSLSDPSLGSLEKTTVVTDAAGVAMAHFNAGSNPGDVKIIPTVVFEEVTGQQQSVATSCGSLPVITILPPTDKWTVSFSYSGSALESYSSPSGEGSHITYVSGSGSLLIRAAPPQEGGYALINTGEGDSVVQCSLSASASENQYSVTRDILGAIESKNVSHYRGELPPGTIAGVEFESGPDGTGLGGIGFGFTRTGTVDFWKKDDNNHLVKQTYNETDPGAYSVLLGCSGDVVKKTKDGFTIDYTESKDTSYTDLLGTKTIRTSSRHYHVTITKPTSTGKGKKSAYTTPKNWLRGEIFLLARLNDGFSCVKPQTKLVNELKGFLCRYTV